MRIRKPNGNEETSAPFNIARGVLQGDIFSPIAFITGLMHIFKIHDNPNAGVTVGVPPNQVSISSLEYADDAGLLDENVQDASERISSIAAGSREDAAMEISIPKTKALHIHKKVTRKQQMTTSLPWDSNTSVLHVNETFPPREALPFIKAGGAMVERP